LLVIRRRAGWRTTYRHDGVPIAVLATLTVATLLASPASAVEVKAPIIERAVWEADGEIYVGAHVNPEGLATTYEIQVECPSYEPCQHTEGQLSGVEEVQTVGLALVESVFDSTYVFTVIASNSAGRTSDTWKVISEGFTPAPGVWTPGDQEEADRATAEVEAERQRTKEQEEQKRAAEVAGARAAEAATLSRRHEEEVKEALAREEAEHPVCIVPAVRGDTLARAHRALIRAHCRVGKVTRPRHNYRTLRVTVQASRPGQRLANGAPVAITLGAGRKLHVRRA
jgi:hypothetical protein